MAGDRRSQVPAAIPAVSPAAQVPGGATSIRARRVARVLPVIALTGGAALLLWLTLASVLAVDRGLDQTDEGLYLLAADPPTPQASWLFPWGWHTGPLFRLVGYDVATFRAAGAVLLVLACALLGWIAVAAARRMGGDTGGQLPSPGRSGGVALRQTGARLGVPACGAAVGGIGAMLYYGGFIRTPSYNWLNLFGIAIAAAGYVALAATTERAVARPRRWRIVLAATVASLGLFAALPAKPSTSAFLLVAGGALLVVTSGVRRAVALTAAVVALIGAWLVIALGSGAWPLDFAAVFVRAIETPTPSSAQTVSGAVRNVLGTPGVVASLVAQAPRWALAVAVVGLACLAAAAVARARRHEPAGRWAGPVTNALAAVGLTASLVGALGLAAVPVPLVTHARPVDRSLYAPVVLAGLVVLAAGLLALPALRSRARTGRSPGAAIATAEAPSQASEVRSSGDEASSAAAVATSGRPAMSSRHRRRWAPVAIAVFVALLPFVFGFGSSNGTFAQASFAAGLLFLAATVAVAAVPGRPGGAARAGILVAVTVIAGVTLADSRARPYRGAPIDTQTEATAVGVRGAKLRLDPDIASVLTSLRAQATAAGFRPGMPLVGVLWRWPATLSWHLGATVPDSLVITLFGWPGTQAMLDYNLAHGLGPLDVRAAWVLAGRDGAPTAPARAEVARAVASLEAATGRPFPGGYECVAAAATVELWRPTDETRASPGTTSSCPAPDPPGSAYDWDQGWRGR